MLFSMSNIQVDRWKETIDALSQTLNMAKTTTSSAPSAEYNISSVFRQRAINLDYLLAVFEDKVKKDELVSSGEILLLEDRLVIPIPGDLLFPPNAAVLTADARRALLVLEACC